MDYRKIHDRLLQVIKSYLPELEGLQGGHWGYEDPVYRFYHQSFKVYMGLQSKTQETVTLFRKIGEEAGLGDRLHPFLETIIGEGTGHSWRYEHNARWLEETRPMVEAFLHVCHMLRMMIKYGNELDEAPTSLPSGWATVLYLYNVR